MTQEEYNKLSMRAGKLRDEKESDTEYKIAMERAYQEGYEQGVLDMLNQVKLVTNIEAAGATE